jgi:hypothetical protein
VKLVHEIVIVTLETLGLLLVSAGLGAFAAWWLGTAGLLTVTGLCLFVFAMLAAWRQQSMSAPPKSANNNAGRR